ncbi:hypothetical protein [Euzebya sp.]|uniref:hypothetical protein n=1 Tax=Euzebya sp. TaxID=1971409 RepID=UPI0035122235
MDRIPKPAELLAAREASAALFSQLQRWFDVPDEVSLDLRSIDSADAQLVDAQYVMATAMRKLQALHLLTTPGVVTTTDVVLTIVQDLERALQQAPRARLRREAATTDWDAELAALGDGDLDAEDEPETLLDDESRRFREAHRTIRKAAQAVLQASEGRIRRLG